MIAEKHRNVISILLFIVSIFYFAGGKSKKKARKASGCIEFFGRKGWIISSRLFFSVFMQCIDCMFLAIYAVYGLHIIAHHYFDIDESIVFDVIKNKLPGMLETINKMIDEI